MLTNWLLVITNATYPKRIHHKFVSIVRQALRNACLAPITTFQFVKEHTDYGDQSGVTI